MACLIRLKSIRSKALPMCSRRSWRTWTYVVVIESRMCPSNRCSVRGYTISSLPRGSTVLVGSSGARRWRGMRPCSTARANSQPRQAPESQAWILPVFVEKCQLLAELEADVSVARVSGLGPELADLLTRFFIRVNGLWPLDVSIRPILAAAHACWANAKMIAVHEWAKGMQTRAQAEGRAIVLEEGPHRGAVQVRDARTRRMIAALEPDASFPVDGTRMAIELLTNGRPAI